MAIATKFLPAVVAPVLWRRRAGWRTALAAIVVIAVLYALYSRVGTHMFGFLGGYGSEEGYDNGEGFWLLAGLSRVTALPEWAAAVYKAASVVVLGAFAAWFAFIRRPDDPVAICGAAGTMMALLMFVISPHYPWYFAWLAVPAVLAPNPAMLWLSAVPVLIYLDGYGDNLLWSCIVYVPALVLALLSLRPFRTARWMAAHPINGEP